MNHEKNCDAFHVLAVSASQPPPTQVFTSKPPLSSLYYYRGVNPIRFRIPDAESKSFFNNKTIFELCSRILTAEMVRMRIWPWRKILLCVVAADKGENGVVALTFWNFSRAKLSISESIVQWPTIQFNVNFFTFWTWKLHLLQMVSEFSSTNSFVRLLFSKSKFNYQRKTFWKVWLREEIKHWSISGVLQLNDVDKKVYFWHGIIWWSQAKDSGPHSRYKHKHKWFHIYFDFMSQILFLISIE